MSDKEKGIAKTLADTWESQGICTDCLKAVVTAWLAEAPCEVAAALDIETEEV